MLSNIKYKMSDIVLKSQERGSQRFLDTEIKADHLSPIAHASVSGPVSLEKHYTTPIGSESFGSQVEYELPYGYLKDLYVMVNLGALTSGSYCKYPGLSLIDQVELRSGSNVLQSFRYEPTMHYCLSRMSDEYVEEVKSVAGSTAFSNGWTLCPLPLFFTKLGNGGIDPPPLNSHLSSTKLRLRLTFRQAADIADAGATVGSPTISTRLYYLNCNPTSELRAQHIMQKETYLYKGVDFQTLSSSTVANSTSSTIDASSFFGNIHDISVNHYLVSNRDTSHEYFQDEGKMQELKVRIDGRDYWLSEQGESLRFDKLLLSEFPGRTNTFGDPCIVPFSTSNDPQHFSGGLEMDSVNKLEIVVKHSAGANCYVDVTSRQNCFWSVSGGSFIRMN